MVGSKNHQVTMQMWKYIHSHYLLKFTDNATEFIGELPP